MPTYQGLRMECPYCGAYQGYQVLKKEAVVVILAIMAATFVGSGSVFRVLSWMFLR